MERLSRKEIMTIVAGTAGALTLSSAITFADSSQTESDPSLSTTPEPSPIALEHDYINRTPIETLSIHAGSFSIDNNELTQEDIESAVNAMVDAVPNLTHISIGTYLDYPEQIKMWTDAVHGRGKQIYIRSAGFTSWTGAFGDKTNGSPEQHIKDFEAWVNDNYEIFEDGDIVEAVPDEASNGTYWFKKYGDGGVGSTDDSKAEFNNFVVKSIAKARSTFNEKGKQGVVVEVFHDNPSVVKDVITQDTASKLKILGTDNYPENEDTDTPEEAGLAMLTEIYTWKRDVHPDLNWEITMGLNNKIELKDKTQGDMVKEEVRIILATEDNINGITFWQLGEKDNWPSSRLFNYEDGHWFPREATEVITEIEVEPQLPQED